MGVTFILEYFMKLIQTYPQNNAKNICIDTEIALFFDVKPTLNNSGLLRVYDYQTDELIDCLDLSIPNGPVEPRKNPSADYLHTFYRLYLHLLLSLFYNYFSLYLNKKQILFDYLQIPFCYILQKKNLKKS